MKKLLVSLLGAAALAIPASAHALPTNVVYNVFIANGPVDLPAGQMIFDLDADLPAYRQCRYYVEWDNAAYLPISADGFVVEYKTHGSASCLLNAFYPVHSVVTADPHYPFYGFDRFAQYRAVSIFTVGEDGENAEMNGIIAYAATPGSPPSYMINSVELEVGP